MPQKRVRKALQSVLIFFFLSYHIFLKDVIYAQIFGALARLKRESLLFFLILTSYAVIVISWSCWLPACNILYFIVSFYPFLSWDCMYTSKTLSETFIYTNIQFEKAFLYNSAAEFSYLFGLFIHLQEQQLWQ